MATPLNSAAIFRTIRKENVQFQGKPSDTAPSDLRFSPPDPSDEDHIGLGHHFVLSQAQVLCAE